MRRSSERILTTHAGSLPRPENLTGLFVRRAAAIKNQYYDSGLKYLEALGDALRIEYEAIVRSGFVLQIDAPDLALERHISYKDEPLSKFLEFVEQVVAVINRALAGIPPDRVRLHVCWGNSESPHDSDVPLED